MTATGFAEYHDELRSVARDLLAKDGPVAWSVLAGAGWTGLEVSEDCGGAGATFHETAVVCTEIGRAARATDHLGAVVLAVGTLNLLSPSETRDELLTGIASGETRVAVALESLDFVPDADGADRILVVANGGVAVAADLTVTPLPVVDETRRLARVSTRTLEPPVMLRFAGDADAAIGQIRQRAAVAVACDSLGLAEAMLDATVSYAKVRQQFGRPIGSFQAVKHACADMLVDIAVTRQLVAAAVAAITDRSAEAGTAAAMAKAHAGEMAVRVAGAAMQLHGGIGYTWESGIHVYLKRAALNRSLFGSPAALRAELATRYP